MIGLSQKYNPDLSTMSALITLTGYAKRLSEVHYHKVPLIPGFQWSGMSLSPNGNNPSIPGRGVELPGSQGGGRNSHGTSKALERPHIRCTCIKIPLQNYRPC